MKNLINSPRSTVLSVGTPASEPTLISINIPITRELHIRILVESYEMRTMCLHQSIFSLYRMLGKPIIKSCLMNKSVNKSKRVGYKWWTV